MSRNAGTEATNGVGSYSLGYKFSVTHRIEHGSVSTEIATPTHTHGRKNRNGIACDDAFRDKPRHKTQGGSNSTKCGYWK